MSDNFFRLKSPCKTCPFRKDVAPFLREVRVQEILQSIAKEDRSFSCHNTIVYEDREDGPFIALDSEVGFDETYQPVKNSDNEAFCAGVLIFLENIGGPNMIPRIGYKFGWYSPDNLKNKELVFSSADEMLRAAREHVG